VSMLESYFSGRKDLFTGLDIINDEKEMAEEEEREEWIKYPVINISFDAKNYDSAESLKAKIAQNLQFAEAKYDCQYNENVDVDIRFGNLIKNVYEKTGSPVVILIDEYDKAMLQVVDKPELLDEFRDILKGFYCNLKAFDQYIKFAFITGVTKFSKVSIFSDLNNLNDISLDDEFADICGITKDELMTVFKPEIEVMSDKYQISYSDCLARLKKNYDGYHFTPAMIDIYNPFCLITAFSKLNFGSYWFENASPTFLIKMIRRVSFDVKTIMKGFRVALKDIADYRLSYTNVVPMMYQSGYLTIKEYDKEDNLCLLGYPNEEVEYAFMNKLLGEFSYLEDDPVCSYPVFASYVRKGQVEEFMTAIKAIFAHIPYPTAQKQYELDYQTIFYLIFTLMGQIMRTEVVTFSGRIDAVCETKDFVYLFEFKLDGSVEDALKQIDDKDYAVGYEASGKNVVKIGVAFDTQKRNISDWKMI
ncbi:MAG: AAA family ATPase, partial [Spirochaetales bacterium]|nr:AAA family ATPase [Spirochaetales bacterium]